MSITSSGLVCDVCGKHILPIFDESYERFGVRGVDRELSCHNECKQYLIDAGKEWKMLPEGPLRQAFNDAEAAAENTAAENVRMREALIEAIEAAEDFGPRSCGRCGSPDSQCDMMCVDGNFMAEKLSKWRAALSPKPATEEKKP